MLFTTKVELELLLDQSMYEFFESGMRGGCSTIFKRLATANSDKLKNYDPRIEGSTIFYTDCNFVCLFVWGPAFGTPVNVYKYI